MHAWYAYMLFDHLFLYIGTQSRISPDKEMEHWPAFHFRNWVPVPKELINQFLYGLVTTIIFINPYHAQYLKYYTPHLI